MPRDGAIDVPLNARILLSAEHAGAAKWAAADTTSELPPLKLYVKKGAKFGGPVKAAISTMLSEAWGTVYVVKPSKSLAAQASYSLVREETGAARQVLGSFSTSRAEDKSAPFFAGVDKFTAVVSYRGAGPCDQSSPPFNELTWKYEEAKDDTTAPGDLLRILYVQRKGEPRSVRLIEPSDAALPVKAVGSGCSAFMPKFQESDVVCGVMEVVDLAGNASGGGVEQCMSARKRTGL